MTAMLRVALRPRFLGLLALMIAATLVCGLLATWQWQRAHRALTAEPAAEQVVPLADLLAVGEPVTNAAAGRIVGARGTFAADEQVLVPGRRIDGTDAVIVVTALHVPQDDGSIARLPVARGWIAEDDVRGADGSLDAALAPAPPAGEVELTGRLEASEEARAGVADDGTTETISTPMLVNAWGSPMYSGYVAQVSDSPGLSPMPAADSAFSRGLNWQNLGYALQWVVFGAFFLYLWWRSVRTRHLDEQADRAERAEAARSHPSVPEAHTGDDHTPPAPAGTTASADAKEDGSADYPAPR